MLVTDLVNVRYLSGFTGSNAALLIRADDDTPVLATDGRYVTQAAQQVPGRRNRHRTGVRAASGGPRRGRRGAPARLREPRRDRRRLRARCAKAAGDVELVRAAGTVEALREVKDAGEIALLRLACEAADAALTDLVDARRPAAGSHREGGRPRAGVADARPRRRRGVVRDHRRGGRELGDPAPPARPTPCSPRATSSRSTSARWSRGYHSDMTRTFVLAPVAQWQLDLYDLVADRAAGRPGGAGARASSLRDVDAASRQVIADAGYAENFGHGLGHGVGLQIHEAPGISASAAGTLLAGSAVTVEPGVYLPGRGGVRIEDTLVVGSENAPTPELLTRFPKELAIHRRETRSSTDRGIDRRLQERARPADRRPAVADHRVPARQAGQGSRLRAHQAQERAVRQGRRQDVQRRREGGDRDRRPPRHHLPVPRRHATSSSWTPRTTSSTRCRSRWSATTRELPAGEHAGADRVPRRARRCTSSCP